MVPSNMLKLIIILCGLIWNILVHLKGNCLVWNPHSWVACFQVHYRSLEFFWKSNLYLISLMCSLRTQSVLVLWEWERALTCIRCVAFTHFSQVDGHSLAWAVMGTGVSDTFLFSCRNSVYLLDPESCDTDPDGDSFWAVSCIPLFYCIYSFIT